MTLCGMAGAYLLNRADSAALLQTEGFISWVRHVRSQIECFSMPLREVLLRCPDDVYVSCGYGEEQRPSTVDEFIRGCSISDGETQKHMARFCADIGKGYREEQLVLCDYTVGLLEERRRALSDQLPARKKRNSALCMSGALTVVILLI